MSEAPAITELLAGLPVPVKTSVSIRKLDGGLNNQVYRITGDNIDYVLRIGPKQPGLPDISSELSILGHASAADIGPEVAFVNPGQGVLMLKFVPGRSWDRDDLLDSANLESLADLLRRLHALPTCGTRLDIHGIAENHARTLYPREDLREFGSTCIELVGRQVGCASRACCHNDVVAANLVAGDVLRLIDWEWAADNDPMFDLASVVAYHDLEPEHADRLLSAYAGGNGATIREQFIEQLRLFDALQWLWLAAREASRPDKGQLARLRALQSRIRA